MNNGTTEWSVMARVMQKTRDITLMYFKLLRNTDLQRTFEINGIKLNSPFWIMAHLAVTENFLLNRSTGGPVIKIPWARQFGMGSEHSLPEACPPLDEVLETLATVHKSAMDHVASLSDDLLDQPNTSGFEFLGEKTYRSVMEHAIRHEGTHSGHLGWLCKLNGIKTI